MLKELNVGFMFSTLYGCHLPYLNSQNHAVCTDIDWQTALYDQDSRLAWGCPHPNPSSDIDMMGVGWGDGNSNGGTNW